MSADLAPSVPLLDIKRQYEPLADEIEAAVTRVLRSSQYVLGPDVRQLESAMAEVCQTRHAIGCASGSDALLLALMAADVGPGDEVIVPSYTFFATASAVARLGATIVFADIEPTTYNISIDDFWAKVTPSTKAIIPVHLFGQCVDMDAINQIAKDHDLTVIEDAAQAIGAEYKQRRAGSIGHVGCFSFYPTKNLGGVGDAGMLTTNNDQLAEKLSLLRVHGMHPRYYHKTIGINSRLDSVQAAVLNVKMPSIDKWTQMRQTNAQHYAEFFTAAGLADVVGLPSASETCLHVWNQYVIRVPNGRRDALREHLAANNVGTEIYYPVPLHQQECFEFVGYETGSLPHTEQAAAETLALPIFPELKIDEQRTVVAHIGNFFAAKRAVA